MDDFIKQAKDKYDQLLQKEKQLNEQLTKLKDDIKPYRAMLREAGLLETPKRKPRQPQGQQG